MPSAAAERNWSANNSEEMERYKDTMARQSRANYTLITMVNNAICKQMRMLSQWDMFNF